MFVYMYVYLSMYSACIRVSINMYVCCVIGMYKNANIMPLTETDEVKDNGARNVEKTVIAANIPYTFIRPQYFYGPKTSKRYLGIYTVFDSIYPVYG